MNLSKPLALLNRFRAVIAPLVFVVCSVTRLVAQQVSVPGFTPESFAILKSRAEAGDEKAQELYNKVIAANREWKQTVDKAASEKDALDNARAEAQVAEAAKGIVTADQFTDIGNAFVVNGFYIGMPIGDAKARLVRVLPTMKVRSRPRSSELAESVENLGLEGLWIGDDDELFCLAVEGRVVRFLVPAACVDNWLNLETTSHNGQELREKIQSAEGRSDSHNGGPTPENYSKTMAGAGFVMRLNQRVYHLGLANGCEITYFGQAQATSDLGVSSGSNNAYMQEWLKKLRELGDLAKEGTLRIDIIGFQDAVARAGAQARSSTSRQNADSPAAKEESVPSGGGASPATTLPGLFGMAFGTTYSPDERCETNNLFSLAYEYVPDKPFNEFTDYYVFASPVTRTVYQVRGAYTCETKADAEAKVAEIAPLLELKFKRMLQNNEGGRIMRFPGGNRIEVEIVPRNPGYSVVIDAVAEKYDAQDTQESMTLKDAYARSLVEPLGKTPKAVLPASAVLRTDESGGYLATVPGALHSLGFSSYALHVLQNTGRIGTVKATFIGNASESGKVFEMTKSQLQLLFGPVVMERPEQKVAFSTVIAEKQCRFQLDHDATVNSVILAIEDVGAIKADALKAAADDLDAL